MTSCSAIQEDIKAYLDRELPFWRRAAVQRHLMSCPSCKDEADALTQLSAGIREWDQITDPGPMDAALRARILANIPDAASVRQSRPAFRLRGWQLTVGTACAAVLLIAVVTRVPLWTLRGVANAPLSEATGSGSPAAEDSKSAAPSPVGESARARVKSKLPERHETEIERVPAGSGGVAQHSTGTPLVAPVGPQVSPPAVVAPSFADGHTAASLPTLDTKRSAPQDTRSITPSEPSGGSATSFGAITGGQSRGRGAESNANNLAATPGGPAAPNGGAPTGGLAGMGGGGGGGAFGGGANNGGFGRGQLSPRVELKTERAPVSRSFTLYLDNIKEQEQEVVRNAERAGAVVEQRTAPASAASRSDYGKSAAAADSPSMTILVPPALYKEVLSNVAKIGELKEETEAVVRGLGTQSDRAVRLNAQGVGSRAAARPGASGNFGYQQEAQSKLQQYQQSPQRGGQSGGQLSDQGGAQNGSQTGVQQPLFDTPAWPYIPYFFNAVPQETLRELLGNREPLSREALGRGRRRVNEKQTSDQLFRDADSLRANKPAAELGKGRAHQSAPFVQRAEIEAAAKKDTDAANAVKAQVNGRSLYSDKDGRSNDTYGGYLRLEVRLAEKSKADRRGADAETTVLKDQGGKPALKRKKSP